MNIEEQVKAFRTFITAQKELSNCRKIIGEMDNGQSETLDRLYEESKQKLQDDKRLTKCRKWLKNKRYNSNYLSYTETTKLCGVSLDEMDKEMLIDAVSWLVEYYIKDQGRFYNGK